MIEKEIKFNNLKSRNRIGMPAMDTLMAKDGFANEFHIQHYGARSYGGCGIIIVESTGITSEGRIRDKDLGLWKNKHINNMKKISNIIKMGGAIAGIQLNHAGAKSEVTNITKIGPTKFYDYLDQTKLKMINENDLIKIENAFVNSAKRAKKAGFDFVEIHAAHGYLLNQLLHPILNEFNKSKSIVERGQILINIVNRIAHEVKIPVGIRFSFNDHDKKGMIEQDYKPIIKMIDKNVDYYNVSSGETISRLRSDEIIKIAKTKLFRIPIVKNIKKMTNKPLFMAGNISSRKDVLEVLKAGADVALIGREHIWNPNVTLNTILKVQEISESKYHWNNNPWFNPKKYIDLMKKLKLK